MRFKIERGTAEPGSSIAVGSRIENDFPYAAIPIVVLQYDSTGQLQTRDTVLLPVSDGQTLQGDGIHLKVNEAGEVPLDRNAVEIALVHGYKGHRLLGITDVGINVGDVNARRQFLGR